MDPLLGLVAASGWASGLNVYLVTLLVGGAGRLGLLDAPDVLTHPATLIAAGVLFAVELVADKVPWLDSVWDAVHTAVRPLGAGLIAYALTGDWGVAEQAAAAGGSGALALTAHAAKATVRGVINLSPEPVTNATASVAEDGLAAGTVILAIAAPVLALGLVALLVLASAWVVRRLWRSARRRRAPAEHQEADGHGAGRDEDEAVRRQ